MDSRRSFPVKRETAGSTARQRVPQSGAPKAARAVWGRLERIQCCFPFPAAGVGHPVPERTTWPHAGE